MKNDKQGVRRAAPRQAAMARLHLFIMMALTASIAVAATAVSIGVARAQGMHAMAQPDTSLVVALMVAAIGVMGGLSAIAMRFAGRSRHR